MRMGSRLLRGLVADANVSGRVIKLNQNQLISIDGVVFPQSIMYASPFVAFWRLTFFDARRHLQCKRLFLLLGAQCFVVTIGGDLQCFYLLAADIYKFRKTSSCRSRPTCHHRYCEFPTPPWNLSVCSVTSACLCEFIIFDRSIAN